MADNYISNKMNIRIRFDKTRLAKVKYKDAICFPNFTAHAVKFKNIDNETALYIVDRKYYETFFENKGSDSSYFEEMPANAKAFLEPIEGKRNIYRYVLVVIGGSIRHRMVSSLFYEDSKPIYLKYDKNGSYVVNEDFLNEAMVAVNNLRCAAPMVDWCAEEVLKGYNY